MEQENTIIEVLDISPEWVGSEWINNYYELLTDLCELERDQYIGTDLDWFVYETDFGRKKDYNRIYDINTGKVWTISSPEILYDYIMRDE